MKKKVSAVASSLIHCRSMVWALVLTVIQTTALILLLVAPLRWFLAVEVLMLLTIGFIVLVRLADLGGQAASQQRQLDRLTTQMTASSRMRSKQFG